jgi:hypothetical protein
MISPLALIPTPHCGPDAFLNSIRRRPALTSLASVILIATPNLPAMRLVLEVLFSVHRPATPVTPVIAG